MKSQLTGTAFSLVLGWWGFPWGLLFTPVQTARNIAGMVSPPEPSKPSPQLEKIIRMAIAAQARKQPAQAKVSQASSAQAAAAKA
jgi:hypothetical protein